MNKILIKHNCLLAHCFTYDHYLGDIFSRIKFSINNESGKYKISASTIKIGDTAFNNYYGSIGIILKDAQINYCLNRDAGTFDHENESYGDDEGIKNPTTDNLEDAIINKGISHNEFRLNNYRAIGIFISQDPYGKAIAEYTFKSYENFYNNTKELNLPYYFLKQDGLFNVEFSETKKQFIIIKKTEIKELYEEEI